MTVMGTPEVTRRYTVGAELQKTGGAHVRVWAPTCKRVELVGTTGASAAISMDREPDGHFSAFDRDARAGDCYWFRLDGEVLRPDPMSRFQPQGPHGPSQYVDPRTFAWSDREWRGIGPVGQVIYEMHVGTFTREGTWAAAANQLDELARIGVTIVEMMPVSEFAGRFGWGYDGVNPYAPFHHYGEPDDLRRFVDRAHAAGLGVILDVVYNHLGPAGNYLADFSPDYFTDRYKNDWGAAINFEGPVEPREFFVQNAAYWIDEFHFDGLRLDATQDIKDASPEHVIASMTARARVAAGERSILVVAENEPQDARIVRSPDQGGYGADALWNDDAHHTAVVALTGRREAYYTDYRGTPQELISCARFGYLYQGQRYSWQKKRRGTSTRDLPPHAFVLYLENHDQVANSAFGQRLHQLAAPGRFRALTAWMLLGPETPMLFQGQEFAASRPFLYFADHSEELAEGIRSGRREFLSQFPSVRDGAVQDVLPSPTDEATFMRCKLDLSERDAHGHAYAFHRDLLKLRRHDPVLSRAGVHRPEGAVLGSGAFLLRYVDVTAGDRLIVINLEQDLDIASAPEPLLAPPDGDRWRLTWSSEAPEYGGHGTPDIDTDTNWRIPGGSALFFTPSPRSKQDSNAGPDTQD